MPKYRMGKDINYKLIFQCYTLPIITQNEKPFEGCKIQQPFIQEPVRKIEIVDSIPLGEEKIQWAKL